MIILFERFLLSFEKFTYFHFFQQFYGMRQHSILLNVIEGMGELGRVYKPDKRVSAYHERKYKVFLEMVNDQEKYNKIMS